MKTLSSLAVSVLASFAAFAGDLYVSTNDLHVVDGVVWGSYITEDGVQHNAYTNLQQAVNAAVAKDTVWVENGFVCDAKDGYSPASGKWCNSRLRINPGVTVRSRSGHWTSGCVIEGSAVEPKVGGVHFAQNDHSGKLIGFEIRNCERNNTSGGKAVYYGMISNCFVHTCLQDGSTLENTWVYDSVISNCWAGLQGIAYNGALYNCEIVDIGKGLSSTVSGGQLVLQGRSNVNVGIVSNCTFRNCYGRPWLVTSKQVYDAVSAPLLMDCHFVGCTGGAVVGTEYGSTLYINLTNCVFTGNKTSCISFSYVAGSRQGQFATCWNCTFTNNMASIVNGPGAYYNCLFAGNSSASGFLHNPDTSKDLALYNCTVFGNTGSGNYGTVDGNTRVINTIISANTIKSGYVDSLKAATNCCIEATASVAEGKNNTTEEPKLVNPVGGIYSPSELSPCNGTGSLTAYELTATDLAGRPRTTDGKVSMGAFEYDPTKHYFAVSQKMPTYLYPPATVTFNADVSGFGFTPVFYWDFDGDGVADEVTMVPTLTHAFDVGHWPVALSVSNLTLKTGSTLAYEPFSVTPRPVRYVKAGNEEGAAEPYDTEANAAADIQVAIDYCSDGDEVVILPGTYNVSLPVTVAKDLIVHGSTGNPEDVVIHETAAERCLVVRGAAETIVHSLVLENGGKNAADCQGAGALIAADNKGVNPAYGVLSNIVVRNCRVTQQQAGTPGIGAIGPNAFVTHCVVSNCCSYSGFSNTGRLCALALFLKGGARAENCLIARNYTDTRFPYGIGWDTEIWTDGKLNYSWQGLYHVTVHVGDQSAIRFCTIVGNTASFCGGVNVADSGHFNDCVIAGNRVQIKYMREQTPRYQVWSAFVEPTGDWHYELAGGQAKFDAMVAAEKARAASSEFFGSQTTNAVDVADAALGAGTIVAPTEKLVRNLARGRYDLPASSPAIDVVPADAASAMATKDLVGNRRLFCGAYDLGAFEKQQSGTMILVR